MDRKLKVGLIGANVSYGWSPKAHIPALIGLPEIELAAICTQHKQSAEISSKTFNIPLAFDDYRQMIAREDLDMIGVSVRVPKHHAITMDVLEARKHVYTEWPLGANLKEATEMANMARSKQLLTMTGLQGRCAPELLRLKELIGDGYVGEILSVNLTSFLPGVLSRTSDRTWQKDVNLGATTLTIAFGHVIDGLCMCLGEFKEVSAAVKTQVPRWLDIDTGKNVKVTSPDNIAIAGTLKNGGLVSAHVASIPWHGSKYRLLIYGTEGSLSLVKEDGFVSETISLMGGKGKSEALDEIDIPERLTWIPKDIGQGPQFNVAQMWRKFGESVKSGTAIEPDFDTAVIRHNLLEAIQLSSDTGVRQVVEEVTCRD